MHRLASSVQQRRSAPLPSPPRDRCVASAAPPCSLPFPKAINDQLSTHPSMPIVPKCLELVHNTRVCRVRVDTGRELLRTVLPLIFRHHPGFASDLVLFNFG